MGRGCLGDLCAHHIKRRRHLATRWDPENALILCVKHHSELHTIGEKTFRKKYGIGTVESCPSSWSSLQPPS